jgi:choloylglycine hydrolase
MLKTEKNMCTAIFDNKHGSFFGRTLDLECSYGEKIMRVARGESLNFIHEGVRTCKHALLGMAYDTGSQPLFYDAVNDKGLSAAALNFPLYASYRDKENKKLNLASFEVILYILSQCDSVIEAKDILKNAIITNDDFSPMLKSTPLHWMIADRAKCIVAESVSDGLKIYDNPFGVMTNSPPFPYHTARLCELSYLSPEPQKNHILPDLDLTPYSRGLGSFGLPGDYSSSSRFVRALLAKEHTLMPPFEDTVNQKAQAKRRIFDILGTVSLPYGIARTEKGEPIYTVYTSCIDMEMGEYSYFTFHNRDIKIFKF